MAINLHTNVKVRQQGGVLNPSQVNHLSHRAKRVRFAMPKLAVRRRLRYLPERVTLLMSYQVGWRWLRAFCRQMPLLNLLYKPQIERFASIADGFQLREPERSQALQMHLLGNIVASICEPSLASATSSTGADATGKRNSLFFRSLMQEIAESQAGDPDALVKFSGLERVEQAYAAGRGVILLTYHTSIINFSMSAMIRHFGLPSIMTLTSRRAIEWQQAMARGAQSSTLPRTSKAYVAELTNRAQQTLRQGHFLQIVNDYGYDEEGTFPFAIGGRAYFFKPGFAELSLATGAPVIPYYSAWQEDGRIHTVFLPPLPVPSVVPESLAARRQVVHGMVKSYAEFFENCLAAMPHNLSWGAARHFAERPLHR